MKYNEDSKLMVNKPYYRKIDSKEDSLNNSSTKKFIPIFIIFIIILLILFIFFFRKIIVLKDESYDEYNFTHINQTLLQELNQIIKNYEILDWNTSQNESQTFINPKFSVVIPVYNSNKKIKLTIRSIQYQNISNIEIILIDDNSDDNTIEIIEELQKEDSRIKLLKNKNNKGILYTRSIGVFNTKGKYIFPINSGDIFINDIFKICYENADLNDIDIIEFSAYNISYNTINIPNLLKNKEDKKIIYQPELSNYIYKEINNETYEIIDGLIWGKYIKKEIYKNSIDILNFIIFTEKVFYFEDIIINIGLFRNANSFQYINKIGIIHNDNNEINKYKNKNQFFIDNLKYAMSIYKLTQNTNDVKYAIFEFMNAINLYNKDINEEYKKFAIELYKNIKECKNVNKDKKNEIENKVKKILDKEGELNIYKYLFE